MEEKPAARQGKRLEGRGSRVIESARRRARQSFLDRSFGGDMGEQGDDDFGTHFYPAPEGSGERGLGRACRGCEATQNRTSPFLDSGVVGCGVLKDGERFGVLILGVAVLAHPCRDRLPDPLGLGECGKLEVPQSQDLFGPGARQGIAQPLGKALLASVAGI